MLSLLQKSAEKPAIRSVNIYVADATVIVAATHQNLDGIYFEQPSATLVEGVPLELALGQAFQVAFNAFSVVNADMRNRKKSDWPACQASGARSLAQFEKRFRLVCCYGLNPSNAVVRASTPHPGDPEIELSVSFNPSLSAEVIGAQLLRLVRAAIAT